MKTKLHIDIGTYEFIEFELETSIRVNGKNEAIDDTEETLRELYKKYHKMGDKIQLEEKPKKQSRKELPVDGHEAL